jgi:hypothetical protein
MEGKGPRSERETVINFNEEDETATIWTASGSMDRRLRKLGLEVVEDGDRHTVFRCFKSQVKVHRVRILSPKQLEAAKERAKHMRQGVSASNGIRADD